MVRVIPAPGEEEGGQLAMHSGIEDEGGGAKIDVIGWLVSTSPTPSKRRGL